VVNLRSARVLSWLVVSGIVVVAVGAWGYYIWRSGVGTLEPSGSQGPSTAQPAGAVAQGESTPRPADAASPVPDEKASQTSADTEAAGPERRTGRAAPSASISVNSPGGFTEQNEIKLKEASGGDVSRDPGAARSASKQGRQSPAGAPAEATPPKTSVSPDLDAGRAALAKGNMHAARAALSAALNHNLPPADEAFARAELGRIADALVFSRATTPDDPLIGTHVVGSGESLNSIARQNKITEELLISINRIKNPDILPAGQRLKVIHGPFNAVIDKAAYRMDIYLGNVFVRDFKVGLGSQDGTPRGTWTVRNKLRDPDWTDPNTGRHYVGGDPANPIGDRWIGLHCLEGECAGRTGFGLHGTIDRSTIGQNMSMGCIRLTPEDVAFVYDLFVEEVSRVTVR
jgi:lipoprotein-anchoring transpeptidase ErfK/SrfK